MKGYQLYHNFVRPHEGLNGKTPAEACGISIEGQNKWLTIIQNAKKEQFRFSALIRRQLTGLTVRHRVNGTVSNRLYDRGILK